MLSARWMIPSWRNMTVSSRQYWWPCATACGNSAPRSNSRWLLPPPRSELAPVASSITNIRTFAASRTVTIEVGRPTANRTRIRGRPAAASATQFGHW